MDPYLLGLAGVILLIEQLVLGTHVGIALAVSGFAGLFYLQGFEKALATSVSSLYGKISTTALVTLPLFILVKFLASGGGISRDIYRSLELLIGRFKSGLGIATVIGCTAFGTEKPQRVGDSPMKYKNKHVLKLEDGRDEPIKDLEGASRIILIDEEQVGAEDITFGYSKYRPKSSLHRKHRHREAEEIMYILHGKGIGGVNDEEFELVKGDTLWVPRGAVHWFYNPFDEPCEFIFLYTRPSLKAAAYETLA